ncbi:Platelet-activating factor acetylhydrolase [Podochytrium sp. JEL0797]|nr:Platelet-activating factor acetylhydrolase [Podochytrium sp. JEL0797]
MVLITPAPKFKGAFPVGTSSLETKPTTPTSHGVFASLYYPADLASATNTTLSKWALGPPHFLANGMLNFFGLPNWIIACLGGFLAWFMARFDMFAFRDVPVVSKAQFPGKIPVIVFSHGMAATQTMYSQLVGTLAARGFLVLAVEHRDGSACVSARNAYTETIPHIPEPPQTPEAIQFRAGQLKHRVQELNEGFRLLETLNKGESIDNLLGNAVPELQGRLDLENCVVMGHSFGGATVLCALQEERHPFASGIALDPWMFAVDSTKPISTPLLSIQCETFHTKSTLEKLHRLWHTSTASPVNQFAVVKNTQHNAFSDISLLLPQSLRWVAQGGFLASRCVLETYDCLHMRFLGDVGVRVGGEVGRLGDAVEVVFGEDGFAFLDKNSAFNQMNLSDFNNPMIPFQVHRQLAQAENTETNSLPLHPNPQAIPNAEPSAVATAAEEWRRHEIKAIRKTRRNNTRYRSHSQSRNRVHRGGSHLSSPSGFLPRNESTGQHRFAQTVTPRSSPVRIEEQVREPVHVSPGVGDLSLTLDRLATHVVFRPGTQNTQNQDTNSETIVLPYLPDPMDFHSLFAEPAERDDAYEVDVVSPDVDDEFWASLAVSDEFGEVERVQELMALAAAIMGRPGTRVRQATAVVVTRADNVAPAAD